MPNSVLYPEPPHLSIAVFCDGVEDKDALRRICEVLREEGGVPTGDIIAAPKGSEFEMVSDIVDAHHISVAPGSVFPEYIEEGKAEFDPVKIGFRLEPVGLAVATFDLGRPGAHPVSLVMGAGALGIPDDIRSKQEMKQARKISRFSLRLMQKICEEVRPLYGGIDIEASLPGLARIKRGDIRVNNAFVSDRLLESGSKIPGLLHSSPSGSSSKRWGSGVYMPSSPDFSIDSRNTSSEIGT